MSTLKTGNLVKFIYVPQGVELPQETIDNAIYFVEGEKKIYVNGVDYGFSDDELIEITTAIGTEISTHNLDADAHSTIITALETAIGGKVDIVEGKGLSTNDYTTDEKSKLGGIDTGAQKNVQGDWNQTDDTKDDYIKGKPTIPTVPTNVSAFTNDAGYLTSHQSLANYYTKTEVDSLVGDIETVLDTILGV